MLGIRRFQQTVSIDVWCGEVNDFVADRTEIGQQLEIFWPAFVAEKSRHLAILAPERDLDSWMKQLHQACHELVGPRRRISLICKNLELYNLVQESMMRHFEEEPCA